MTCRRFNRPDTAAKVRATRAGVALVLAAAAWIPITATAHADTLDQNCTTASPQRAAAITGSAGSGSTLAQTFTPGVSVLGAFDILYINDNDKSAHTLTGKLRQGAPTGTVVATATAHALAGQVGPMWIRFSFSSAQTLTPGAQYAFSVSASAPPQALLWAESAVDYTGGTGFVSMHGVTTDLDADLAFREVSTLSTPAASIGDASVLEGDSASRTLLFPVTLSQPPAGPVTVSYTISGSTATGGTRHSAGVDFNDGGGATRTLTFSAPQAGGVVPTLEDVPVKVYSDTIVEPDEQLTVTLTSVGAGFQLGRSVGVGTIFNDDGISSGTTIGVGDGAVVRGQNGTQTLELPVTLSQRVAAGVALSYSITPLTGRFSTKSGGGDYGGKINGVLSFSSTALARMIAVSVWPDPNPSALARTFAVTLAAVNNPGVSTIRVLGTGTILPSPSTPNLPGVVRNVGVQLASSCSATDPISGAQPGTQIDVTWTAPSGGDAPTSYLVILALTYPSHATSTITLPPTPATQTESGPQCYPIGTHVVTEVAAANDAGVTETASPTGGGYFLVPRTGLAWTSPASLTDGVPVTFASTDPCPTTFADGSPIVGVKLAVVTLHLATRTVVDNTFANPGWSIPNTPEIGSQDLTATISAGCYELLVPSGTTVLIAQYATHAIAVNP